MADSVAIVPGSAAARERAIDNVSEARRASFDVDIIRRAKDPWACPEHLLPYLAYERSVDIWRQDWPVEKQRTVIDAAPEDHRRKATEDGIARYVAHAGGELVETLTPPQAIYAAPDLSRQQWDEWVAKHPKVRITLAHGTVELEDGTGIFADATFADCDFDTFDWGPALAGRRAYLVQDGVHTPLQLQDVALREARRDPCVEERVVLPGEAGLAMFADDGFADVNMVDAVDRAPAVYTFRLVREATALDGDLILTVVPIGFEPRDTTWRRESDLWEDPWGIYADCGFADDGFVTPDISAEKLADVLYLYDPRVPSPEMIGISFADISRVGMEAHNARLMIDLRQPERPGETYADISYCDTSFALPIDESHERFMLDAVASAKKLSDRIGATFATHRLRTLADGLPLDGSYRFGGLVKNHL